VSFTRGASAVRLNGKWERLTQLCKLEVTGSIPVRSIKSCKLALCANRGRCLSGCRGHAVGVWPRFHLQDRVRIRTSGRVGYVNQIEPNERGDDWPFEVAFGPGDLELYDASKLELVEASEQEHEAEIAVAL
jgi:hypothetical protein